MSACKKRACDQSQMTQSKKSSQQVADANLNGFIQWCNERNFNISSKVCVERERVCAQYGMIATEDITAGEVLFSVPRSSLLSCETCSIAGLLSEGQQEMGKDSGWVPLILALLYEYNNPQSPWRSYLDLVPDFTQLDLPMFWNSKEREKLLAGTGVEEAVTRDLALLEKDFNSKALPFMQKHSDTFSPACQSLEMYKKMVAFIMAYSFTEPAGKAEENVTEDDLDSEETECSLPTMMVPMADILNHVAKNNAALNFDVDALHMVCTRDIKKGEEVYNTYGELANKHLLHMYGFAECYPDNHYDTVDIPVSVVTQVAKSESDDPEQTALKLTFLQELDLHQPGESYVLGREGILTDEEMQTVIKVLVMSDEDFKEYVENAGWSDAESDDATADDCLSFASIPELPHSWKKILSRCAETCLSQLGDAQKDNDAMNKSNGKDLPPRDRYSLYVRYGQRKLLQQLVDACR